MTHCNVRTICIAESSKPASRMAIRIFPSSPEKKWAKDGQKCKTSKACQLLRNYKFSTSNYFPLLTFSMKN